MERDQSESSHAHSHDNDGQRSHHDAVMERDADHEWWSDMPLGESESDGNSVERDQWGQSRRTGRAAASQMPPVRRD